MLLSIALFVVVVTLPALRIYFFFSRKKGLVIQLFGSIKIFTLFGGFLLFAGLFSSPGLIPLMLVCFIMMSAILGCWQNPNKYFVS